MSGWVSGSEEEMDGCVGVRRRWMSGWGSASEEEMDKCKDNCVFFL